MVAPRVGIVPVAPRQNVPETPLVKNLRISLLAFALTLVLALSASAKPGWLSDYKKGQEKAKTDKKLVLLDFTGSDWCGWCIKLDKEVFSKPEFQAYANKNLVLVEVDFPRQKVLSAEEKAQNSALAEKYEIEGYPTIIVLDGEGKKLGQLGYEPGGASAFIAELDKLRKG